LDHVLPNLPPLRAKIASWQRLHLHLLHYVMQPVNPHNFIAAKEISVSALPLLNVYLGFVIQSRLALR
jgi:hypothetical protein